MIHITGQSLTIVAGEWAPIYSFVVKIPVNRYNFNGYHRKISNIRRTKFENFNVSHLVLQLPLPNPLKPGVK